MCGTYQAWISPPRAGLMGSRMPTLRLLLALSLIALGTTGAAFAISGYFDPKLWQPEAKASEANNAKLDLAALKARQRFVAIEAKTKATTATATTAVTTTPPARPKPNLAKAPAKKPPPSKDANVQQAAAWWPLSNLFKN
jgi:hypothetical protein